MAVSTIITGCELYVAAGNQMVHGDLWTGGDSFVFNAVLEGGEAHWKREFPPGWTPDADPRKIIMLLSENPRYFERRGIIVFGSAAVNFNKAALNYLKRSLDA